MERGAINYYDYRNKIFLTTMNMFGKTIEIQLTRA